MCVPSKGGGKARECARRRASEKERAEQVGRIDLTVKRWRPFLSFSLPFSLCSPRGGTEFSSVFFLPPRSLALLFSPLDLARALLQLMILNDEDFFPPPIPRTLSFYLFFFLRGTRRKEKARLLFFFLRILANIDSHYWRGARFFAATLCVTRKCRQSGATSVLPPARSLSVSRSLSRKKGISIQAVGPQHIGYLSLSFSFSLSFSSPAHGEARTKKARALLFFSATLCTYTPHHYYSRLLKISPVTSSRRGVLLTSFALVGFSITTIFSQ